MMIRHRSYNLFVAVDDLLACIFSTKAGIILSMHTFYVEFSVYISLAVKPLLNLFKIILNNNIQCRNLIQ